MELKTELVGSLQITYGIQWNKMEQIFTKVISLTVKYIIIYPR